MNAALAGRIAVLACLVLAGAVRAEEAPPAVADAGPGAPAPEGPAALLARAEEAVDAGRLDEARLLFEQILRDQPQSTEAQSARRSLKLLRSISVPAAKPERPPDLGSDEVVFRREPYSLRTGERLRISTWEKIDFGMTAFVYGMSVGLSYAMVLDSRSTASVVAPVATGAVVYAAGAIALLLAGEPDRGDLPLVLGLTSYVPTTAMLVARSFVEDAGGRSMALAAGLTGVAAIPLALIVAQKLDLDPGDTQLVRDAGFWGMVLGATGTLAFGGRSQPTSYGTVRYDQPSGRAIATSALVGLYGGLGLGVLAASLSEVSLERVRLATWGGYGGAVLGGLVGAAVEGEANTFRGVTFGAAGGLVLAFLLSSSIDRIPDDAPRVAGSGGAWSPTFSPLSFTDARRRPGLGCGVSMMLP